MSHIIFILWNNIFLILFQKSQYYEGSDAVIYVVDSCDKDRIEEVRRELLLILNDAALVNVPVLILANKQDLTYAWSSLDLQEHLMLNGEMKKRAIGQYYNLKYVNIWTMSIYGWPRWT